MRRWSAVRRRARGGKVSDPADSAAVGCTDALPVLRLGRDEIGNWTWVEIRIVVVVVVMVVMRSAHIARQHVSL